MRQLFDRRTLVIASFGCLLGLYGQFRRASQDLADEKYTTLSAGILGIYGAIRFGYVRESSAFMLTYILTSFATQYAIDALTAEPTFSNGLS